MRIEAGTLAVDDVDATIDRLRSIGDEHGCTVQAIDARYVAGREHLRTALRLADRAIDRGDAIARSRDVELLLYVAATRQIDRAFELGLSEGTRPVVVVVDDPDGSSGNDSPAEAVAGEDGTPDEAATSDTRSPDEATESDTRSPDEATERDTRSPDEAAAAEAVRDLLDPASFDSVVGNEELIQSWFEIEDEELAVTDAALEALVLDRVVLLALET